MSSLRRAHYLAPATDAGSAAALDHALDQLGAMRDLPPPRDASARLHLLASLSAEAQRRLHGAVAEARVEQCSWAQIGDLLGVTRASAQQRYGTHGVEPDPP
ncbi:MAG: hypothetical protein ACRDQG_09990 [Pseudonocardiaceae bacterium]